MPKNSVANRSAAVESKKWRLTPQHLGRPQQRARRLVAETRLKIRHQERGGDAFAGNIRQNEAERVVGDFEEVVVIAARPRARARHCPA